MEVTENYGMITANKGRIPCLRVLTKYKKKGTFAASKLCINERGATFYDGREQQRVLVRPSTIRRMEGKWDDNLFYAFKKDKLWWVIVHHEGQLFKMRFSEIMFDDKNKARVELFDSVMNKEMTAYDALMLVSL